MVGVVVVRVREVGVGVGDRLMGVGVAVPDAGWYLWDVLVVVVAVVVSVPVLVNDRLVGV